MKLVASIFVFTVIFHYLIKSLFTKKDTSIGSKWYQSLNDKSAHSPFSLRFKFNVDLSFSKMERVYSMKFKKAYAHRQRTNKEELERVHERNLENFPKLSKDLSVRIV